MKKKIFTSCFVVLFSTFVSMAQYTIYPIPHSMESSSEKASFSSQVTVVCEENIDQATRDRVKQVLNDHSLTANFSASASETESNLLIGINGSGGIADSKVSSLGLQRTVFGQDGKYDKHIFSLYKGNSQQADVVVLGENTDAAFYALASLEQILDEGIENLTCTTIYDYADQKIRGIVEGYYGYPYSVSVKKDLMRFMMRYKMNTYLYGAKSDPYHSNYWQDAYPTSITEEQEKNGWLSQNMVKEITDVSHSTKVNFIWAIHPGNNFVNSSSVVSDIMGKFEKMYELGVRQFAVFVDDVSIPSTDDDMKTNADHLTALQQAIEKKWNITGAAATDTVRPLHFVPQIYCNNFASSDDQYNRFFTALSSIPSYITIYTTGAGVWSIPNNTDLSKPKNQLGRSVAWWWNYPCNDNADGQIFPMDMYSNFYDMPSVSSSATAPSSLSNGLGIVSNPMQEGEVAKTPIFSVADMAWNLSAFNNSTSWESSFAAVLPKNKSAQEAYRYLAPYLRYNDPDALNTLITNYKKNGESTELMSLMEEIEENCKELCKLKESSLENEQLLYNDLAPWLLKLQSMASLIKEMLTLATSNSKDDSQWTQYLTDLTAVNALSTAEEYKAYALEGMGSSISVSERPSQPSNLYLLPFVNYMKQHALDGFFENNAVETKAKYASNVPNTKGTITGSTTLYVTQTAPVTLSKGQWMGIEMPLPTKVEKISVSDTLWENHSTVISADGKHWTRLQSPITNPEDYVRYLAVVNDKESPVSIKLNAQSLRITNYATTRVTQGTIPDGDVWENHTENLMRDGSYETFVCLYRNQQNGDTYTIKLNKQQPIYRVRIAMGTTNDDYMTEGKVQISADGTNWTTLKVLGTSSTVYKLSLPQVVKYSDEVTLCDFDGKGTEAQYVRLYVSKANTNKWLRLYEIEANGEGTYTQAKLEDSAGQILSQGYDADPSTSTTNAIKNGSKGILTYYFQNYALNNSVSIYCDPSTMQNVEVSYTRDLNEWTETETNFSTGVARIQFQEGEKDVAALRITWTGTTTPAIYEIVENQDSTTKPYVTSIEVVKSGIAQNNSSTIYIQDGKLFAKSNIGISNINVYALNGKLLLTQHLDSIIETTIPLTFIQQQPIIIQLTQNDGTIKSYRILLK